MEPDDWKRVQYVYELVKNEGDAECGRVLDDLIREIKSLNERITAAETLIEYPPDCDECEEQRERVVPIYGDNVAVSVTLCQEHLDEYNRCYDRWRRG